MLLTRMGCNSNVIIRSYWSTHQCCITTRIFVALKKFVRQLQHAMNENIVCRLCSEHDCNMIGIAFFARQEKVLKWIE